MYACICILWHNGTEQITIHMRIFLAESNINNMSKQLNAKSGELNKSDGSERFGRSNAARVCVMCMAYTLDAKVSMKNRFTNHLHLSCSRNFQSNDDSDGDDVFFSSCVYCYRAKSNLYY